MENSFIHTKISIEEVFPDAFPILKREQYYKLSESEGLLHAVQKIIFDEWSDQLREQVHKNCLEDLGNADKFTSFVYYKLNVQDLLLYLRNHIKNVEFHSEFSTRYSTSTSNLMLVLIPRRLMQMRIRSNITMKVNIHFLNV